ncbi:MAG: hypothetical protein WB607_12940 [Candidatus Acidiferrum sp.]
MQWAVIRVRPIMPFPLASERKLANLLKLNKTKARFLATKLRLAMRA